jgi:hypothetical protein
MRHLLAPTGGAVGRQYDRQSTGDKQMKTMFKKIASITALILFAASVTACHKTTDSTSDNSNATPAVASSSPDATSSTDVASSPDAASSADMASGPAAASGASQ